MEDQEQIKGKKVFVELYMEVWTNLSSIDTVIDFGEGQGLLRK